MKNRNVHPKGETPAAGVPLKPLAVSVKTARLLLEIGNSKMWELISEGRVRTVKIGRKRLVLYESLETLLTPQEATPR